ncbi:MAG: TRAP transporter small permease [Halobacteriovoraceae bacterium]|nr:TRAP transporter small permease [Halobacteriovoraceae bacterium]
MAFKVVHFFDKALEKLSTGLLVFCVMGMLLMSVSNIVLRWFDAHVLWFEPAVRYLVFFSAFLGGAIATGKRSHIGIDIIGKYLESKKMWEAHRWVSRFIDVASLIVLVYLTQACIEFVGEEAKYGRKNVFIGIHAKYLAMIIPFGFGIIAVRFFNGIILSFSEKYRFKIEEEGEE